MPGKSISLFFLFYYLCRGHYFQGIVKCDCRQSTQIACLSSNNNCTWLNGACFSLNNFERYNCNSFSNQISCVAPSCLWLNNICNNFPDSYSNIACSNVTSTSSGCKSYGCVSTSIETSQSVCTQPNTCTIITTKSQCDNLIILPQNSFSHEYLLCGWHSNQTNPQDSNCVDKSNCPGLPSDLCSQIPSCFLNPDQSCGYVSCGGGLNQTQCNNHQPNCIWQPNILNNVANAQGVCSDYDFTQNTSPSNCESGRNNDFCYWYSGTNCYQCLDISSVFNSTNCERKTYCPYHSFSVCSQYPSCFADSSDKSCSFVNCAVQTNQAQCTYYNPTCQWKSNNTTIVNNGINSSSTSNSTGVCFAQNCTQYNSLTTCIAGSNSGYCTWQNGVKCALCPDNYLGGQHQLINSVIIFLIFIASTM